ncbi:MAG: D-aminoacyl-tRNA deacylase [Nanoarchaeota archaeon]
MYEKYLVVASKKDRAGINITTQLSQFRENPLFSSMKKTPSFDFYLVDEEIIQTRNLDLSRINQYDFVIFASKHASEKGEKTLSIHPPGNFRDAKFGGEKGKICKTSAMFQKQMFEKLIKNAEKYHLRDYKLTMEATHHGPLIDKPCLFAEIGSTENEYRDNKAGFVVAKAISEAIEEFKPNPYNEVAIAIGGPHYCPNFNKIQASSNIAISHVISQYVFPLTEEMVKEAIQKTEEEIDFILLDWKGLGNEDHRKIVKGILDKLYLNSKKTSDVKK